MERLFDIMELKGGNIRSVVVIFLDEQAAARDRAMMVCQQIIRRRLGLVWDYDVPVNLPFSLDAEQFLARFPTEEACADLLFELKWPDGFSCPCCDHRQAYKIKTRRLPLYECTRCRHQTSLLVGTVMEGSRTDLRKWLLALFLVACTENSINAVHLAKKLGVTYKTAWLILHKIRHVMGELDARTLLSGFVRVNDAYYNRPAYNSSVIGHPKERPLFVAGSMDKNDNPIYVKMKLVPAKHMSERYFLRTGTTEFAERHAEPDAQLDFIIKRFTSKKWKRLIPIFARANRWMSRTFHGIGPRYLQAYLNEFCYRLNMNFKRTDIMERLAHFCAVDNPPSYPSLIATHSRLTA